MTRAQKIAEGAARWGAYYRLHPAQFVKDYLHINLHLFQKILITMMFWSRVFIVIGYRGLGKTFISAIYCVTRCILYPGTRVCVASGTRGQSILVLEKILQELRPRSPELAAELDDRETKVNNTVGQVVFKNTSVIKVVTASDTARGNRCNVLLLDEFRLLPKIVIDTVLNKFLNYRRMPQYEELTEEERKAEYNKEKNLTMYLSSAYFKDSWAFTKCEDVFDAMVSGKRRQFICGFPYQLGLEEGILDPEQVLDEMSESNFNEISWMMEMGALWYGSEDGAFFDYPSISKNRKILFPMLPDRVASHLPGAPEVRIAPKENGVKRILSADIALMSSRKNNNDATSIIINQLVPTKAGRLTSNILYAETHEGLRTDDQALIIRKLYDEFDCDYIALDAMGVGMGIYDALSKDMLDPETGEIYPALSCINNTEMAARCVNPNAEKVIWSIKADPNFNSRCAMALREGFRNGRIRLLQSELDAMGSLSELKGFNSLSESERVMILNPYIQTTLLIDELTKLQHEEANNKIKIYEKAGMRKDRYSSLLYNYYVAMQVEQRMNRRSYIDEHVSEMFVIKPPSKRERRTVGGRGRY
jgi:hypothetical protein